MTALPPDPVMGARRRSTYRVTFARVAPTKGAHGAATLFDNRAHDQLHGPTMPARNPQPRYAERLAVYTRAERLVAHNRVPAMAASRKPERCRIADPLSLAQQGLRRAH
jgi:hypothetical protein